jgi:hypothetical protein
MWTFYLFFVAKNVFSYFVLSYSDTSQATVGARVHHGAVAASLHDTVEGLPEAVKALRQADWLLSWSGRCHVICHRIT